MLGRSLAFSRRLIDTLLDVARLLAHLPDHTAGVGVKNAIAIHIADAPNSVANPVFKIEFGVACDLAREDNQVAFRECFASDAAQRILFEAGIEDVITDSIANFVGMTFCDLFGGKDVTMGHG